MKSNFMSHPHGLENVYCFILQIYMYDMSYTV